MRVVVLFGSWFIDRAKDDILIGTLNIMYLHLADLLLTSLRQSALCKMYNASNLLDNAIMICLIQFR